MDGNGYYISLQVIEASLIGVLLIIVHVVIYLTLFNRRKHSDPLDEATEENTTGNDGNFQVSL